MAGSTHRGRKAQPVPVLRGRRVTLRPYRMEEIERVLEGVRGLPEESSPWGPPSRERLRRRMRSSGRLWRGRVVLAMEVRGRLIGEIQTYRVKEMPPGTVGLGIMIFEAADRGRGYGTEAIRTFGDWILSSGVASRLEAGTRPGNAAMRRSFAKTGWRELGVERYRGVDFVNYERLR